MFEFFKKIPKRDIIYLIIILLFLGTNYYTWKHNPINQPQASQPAPYPSTESKPTGTIACPDTGVATLDKKKIAKLLSEKDNIIEKLSNWLQEKENSKTPDWIKDKDIVFLADKTFPPYEGETYVASTLNVRTGEGGITYKYKPIPFFDFENQLFIDVGYIALGPQSGHMQFGLTYSPIRLGRWHILGELEYDKEFKGTVKARLDLWR